MAKEEEDCDIQHSLQHQQDADDQVAVFTQQVQQGKNTDDEGEGGEDQHDPPSLYIDGFLIKSILDLQETAEEKRQAPDEGQKVLQVVWVESQQGTGDQQDQAGGQAGFRDPLDRLGTHIGDDGPYAAEDHDAGQNISRDAQGKIAEQDQQHTADKAESDGQDHGTGCQRIRIFFTTGEKLKTLHNRYSSAFIFLFITLIISTKDRRNPAAWKGRGKAVTDG